MALSEQERKLLEQLEASLKAEDPKLADTLSGSATIRVHRRLAALAGLGFTLGVVVLLGGIQLHPAVTVAGFVLMLACALIGTKAWQRVGGDGDGQRRRKKPSPKSSDGVRDFMTELEERWRRQHGDQQ